MATKFDINTVLKNFEDADKDLRYIALSDLASELPKENFKLEGANENKVVEGMIKLLFDVANEVQAQAIVCLTPLLKRISDDNIIRIAAALAQYTTDERKAKKAKETCNSGLKVIVNTSDAKLGQRIADTLGTPIAKGIKGSDEEIVSDALDVAKDLLKRFGAHLTKHYNELLKATLPRLQSGRNIVQQRAINALGELSPFISEKDFDSTIEAIVKQLQKGKNKAVYIQALGNLGSNAGPKLGKHVSKITPLLVSAIKESGEGDELSKENAFRTFNSFLLYCRKDVGDNFDTILKLAAAYMRFDPFMEDFDENEEVKLEEAEDEDDDEEEEEDDSEEESEEEDEGGEDETWKIRSAAVKVVGSAVSSTPSKLKELSAKVGPLLILKFDERERVVRHEVFKTFLGIVKRLGSFQLKEVVAPWVKHVVSGIADSLKSTNEKNKLDAIHVLRAILEVVPNAYDEKMKEIVKSLARAAKAGEQEKLQVAAFAFIRTIVTAHKPEVVLPYVKILSSAVASGAASKHHKVAVAACKTGAFIVANLSQSSDKGLEAVKTIYNAVNSSFEASVLDHTVKDAAISAIAEIVARFGDKVGDQKKILKNLVAKLADESTKAAAARAVVTILNSSLNIDVTCVLGELVKELSACVKQASAQITADSLAALNLLVAKYGTSKGFKGKHNTVIEEVSTLVSPKNLYQAGLGLALSAKVVNAEPKAASAVQSSLYSRVLEVLREEKIGGTEGAAFSALHAALAKAEAKKFGFAEINKQLTNLCTETKVVENKLYDGIGRCIGALIANTNEKTAKKEISSHLSAIKSAKSEASQLLSLAVVGYVGRETDVSSFGDVQKVIAGALSSKSQDVTAAAGRALGDIAVGNIDKFLPFILQNSKDPSKQYSILYAMRQLVIGKSATSEGIEQLSKQLDNITPVLFAAKPKDEASQNLVAECLGKAATVAPAKIIPVLHKRVSDNDTPVRATAVNSLCYIKYDGANSKDVLEQLKSVLNDFLKAISDKELIVRDCALNGLSFVVDRAIQIVRPILKDHMEALYTQAKRSEYREIDYGPYKEYVDATLKGRAVVYDLLYSFLDKCPEVVDPQKYVEVVIAAYNQNKRLRPQTDDILCTANAILVRVAKLAPAAVLGSLEKGLPFIELTIKRKSDNKVKRATVQAVAAVCKIPNWESASSKFTEAVNKYILNDEKMKSRWEALLQTVDLN